MKYYQKRLAIIGAGVFQVPLIKKANELGFETHVFAWKERATGRADADFFYPISITNSDEILSLCKKINPIGVCSIASDLAVNTINYVSEHLKLPGNRFIDTPGFTNKYEMRKKLKRAGIVSPIFQKVNSNNFNILNWTIFPAIVKPTDRSGSRSIALVSNCNELMSAVASAIDSSFAKEAIIEEYLIGNEYSCETISQNGQHHFLSITKKFTTGAPTFIETGHCIPSDLSIDTQSKVKSAVFSALDALGIKNSAGHSEFRIDENGRIFIIEIGARMAGDCIGSHLVPLATGYDFTKMVIDVACGYPLDFTTNPHKDCVKIKFFFTHEDVKSFEAFKAQNEIEVLEVSNIDCQYSGPVIDSSTRLGYYIYSTDKKHMEGFHI